QPGDGAHPAARPNASPTADDADLTVRLRANDRSMGPGLLVTGHDDVIRGLIVDHFATGIELRDAGTPDSGDRNHIEGNFVGVDASGTGQTYQNAEGNGRTMLIGPGCRDNVVGTDPDPAKASAAQRNVLSGGYYMGVEI